MDHYETLGVAQDATAAQIKAAYRKRASETHPDRAQGEKDRQKREAGMQRINGAYATLGDAKKRARYDALLGKRKRTGNGKKTGSKAPNKDPEETHEETPDEDPQEAKAAPVPQYDFNKVSSKHLCTFCNGAGSLMIAAGMSNRRMSCYGCRGTGINLIFANEYSTI